MSITEIEIDLPDECVAFLEEIAEREGRTPGEVAHDLLMKKLEEMESGRE